MDITLHNTLGNTTEPFRPLQEGVVRMYHCGPTVYSRAHIGNLRAYVFADTLRRLFTHAGYEVRQVINITDVGHLTDDADEGEDKVEKAAKKEKKTAKEITEHYTRLFLEDLTKLNIPTEEINFPRATEYIGEQIAMIQTLEQKGYTYRTKDGIYFDTSRFPDYGTLGNIDLAGLKEGARIGKHGEKKHPTDFALWKFSDPKVKRQQEWDSPWGKGFPGWHIECSAMSRALLGSQIDIHTGGVEHIHVHHNNEIAQSECVSGKKPFARYWLHLEHVLVDGKKMSKSLGNIVTLDDVIDAVEDPLAYRYLLLGTHYRKQLNFTQKALQAAATALARLRSQFAELPEAAAVAPEESYLIRLETALGADVDTPAALALLWELAKDTTISPEAKKATAVVFDDLLGLRLFAEAPTPLTPEELPENIAALLVKRTAARKAKDFATADLLRKQIEQAGYQLVDTAEGPQVFAKKTPEATKAAAPARARK